MTDSTPKFKGKYRSASNRLGGWDYRSPGYYYVTICTRNHVPWFGEVIGEQMVLSPVGEIVKDELIKTPHLRPNVSLDAWVVMPNHIHTITIIADMPQSDLETPRRGVSAAHPLLRRLYPSCPDGASPLPTPC